MLDAQHSDLLKGLTAPELHAVLPLLQRRHYASGEVILRWVEDDEKTTFVLHYCASGGMLMRDGKNEDSRRHPLDIAQYTWSKCQLEGQILNWGGDRVDMANSMESRPAFLDHHLAAAAVKVPPNLRIKGNIEKGVLPEVLYKREKFAFMAPPAHTDKSKMAKVEELIGEYLNDSVIADAGICSPERVSKFLSDYRNDTNPTSLVRKDTLLNHLLTLHILHRQFAA